MNATAIPAAPVQRRRHRIKLPYEAYFHSAGLRAKIAALHAGGIPAHSVRKEAVALFRDALNERRALARKTFEDDGGGLACASRFAHIEDQLIGEIFHYVTTFVYPAGDRRRGETFAIAAVGGYGRATLAPGSDIDLLFLVPASRCQKEERIIKAILYMLWDLGQKVGHATRSVAECLTHAGEDMTIRTALLEARLILGDRTLFETMQMRFERTILRGTAAEFVAAKLTERDNRIAQAGCSRYLVEPHVKDGKGGLRDLNTLFWIAKYVYRLRDEADLVSAGLFSSSEYKLFRRCEEFLWRVRCHLHFLTSRAEERLTFDYQRQIADHLGYSTRSGLSSVERFMKHYFLIAKDVGDLTAIFCAALEEKQAKPLARLSRLRPWRRKRAAISSDFEVENGRITVAGPEIFDRDPLNLIKLFWLADRNGLAIHPNATRYVTQALKRINAKLRADPEANRLFLEILTSRNEPEIVLRHMNESGALGRFIPEFGRIVALMQFNRYHHYTVDEHLLRAVGNLAELESQRLAAELPLATNIVRSINNAQALHVALFLHDIAKGRAEDHSRAGVGVARALCPRLGLTQAETETVAWLIANHLIMSDMAQRRDLGDGRTIITFASCVQTLERLKMLFVLTVCDIRAVGPGIWNNWKGQLLRTLYWETELVLAGGYSTTNYNQRVVQAREELSRSLPNWSALEFDVYAARLPEAYWLKATLEQKILHAKLLNKTESEIAGPITDVRTDQSRGVTELTVIARDHPRLLSVVAGACATMGANIVTAQIFTTKDGLSLNTIFISRTFSYDEDEQRRADSVVLIIQRALSGQIRLQDLVAARTRQVEEHREVFHIPAEVSIDNALSGRFTIVEVTGLDRPGLLYELTAALSRLSLNIASARIATFGEKAADVFYVTDLMGEKITSVYKQEAIRRAILGIFGTGEPTASTQTAIRPLLTSKSAGGTRLQPNGNTANSA
jgi:[protein-PII] uridylyltransferase